MDNSRGQWPASLAALAADEDGQDVVEYGALLASIVLVVLPGTTAFGKVIRPWMELLVGRIATVGT